MKVSIRLKIIILGAIVSLLITVVAGLSSILIYYKESVKHFENSIVNVLDNICNEIDTKDKYDEFIKTLKKRISNVYESDPDEPEFSSFSEKEEYYKTKYQFLYPKQGSFGLSLDDLTLRNNFLEFQTRLLDANNFARVKSVYISFYDEARNRIVFLVDSRHGDETEEYYLPGSYYNIESGVNYSSIEDDKVYYNSINNIYSMSKKVTLTDDDLYINCTSIHVEYDMNNIKESTYGFARYTLIVLISIAFLITILYAVLSHLMISRNVSKLNKSTQLFTDNLINSDKKKELELIDAGVKSHDEIGELSNNINSMQKEILAYIKRIEEANIAEARFNAELHVASKIQLEALPESTLDEERIRIDSFIQSAKEVGGDFYDYFYLDNDHIAIIISDVSGKGIPAALFMMKTKELIKSKLVPGVNLSKVFFDINNELLVNNEEGLFITSLVMIINLNTLECELINAGHEKPFLIRNGSVERLKIESNFILGGLDDFEYVMEKIQFHKGDKLILHTDGLNESINDEREEFGYDRISKILENSNNYIDDLRSNLREFVGDNEQFDDVTLLSINLKDSKSLNLKCDKPSMDFITEATIEFTKHYSELSEEIKSKVAIIIDEMINNYVSYEDLETLKIEVNFNLSDNNLSIEFINNGVEFDPLAVKRESIKEYSDDLTPGGFGIMLVKEFTSDIKYERVDGLNKLKMVLTTK